MSWLKDKYLQMVIGLLFETPLGKKAFGWLNGRKTMVGRITSLVSAILLVIQTRFPEYAILANINSMWLLITGVIITELGIGHADLKKDGK